MSIPTGLIGVAVLGAAGSLGCGGVEQAPDPAAVSTSTSTSTGPASVRCPEVGGTWPMVAVPRPDGGAFCIDSREVTNEQYAAFLASGPAPALHPKCAGTTDFAPKDGWPVTAARMRYPVGAVTWCQAQAFCEANQKRLCGDAQGQIRSLDDSYVGVSNDTELTEVRLACTRGGTQAFPYGNEGSADRCPYVPDAEIVAADSETNCEGGYDGIFFLEGNALEWDGACKFENSMEGLSPPFCVAGGRWGCSLFPVDFSGKDDAGGVVDWYPEVGFRCCADALPGE